MIKDHIPLGVGFYPDWFNKHYGISFGKEYYFDPGIRIEARMEIEKRLYERVKMHEAYHRFCKLPLYYRAVLPEPLRVNN